MAQKFSLQLRFNTSNEGAKVGVAGNLLNEMEERETGSVTGLVPRFKLHHPQPGFIIPSMIKTRVLPAAFAALLLIGGVAIAQRPKENISPGRHPNLAAAQRLSQQAWEKIVAAQEANEWDLQGHAQRAKNLLDQVNNELKQAAEASNRRGR
jgi:hypothetical protein